MERKVLFRADGDSTIGLGHLYRLFSLAEMVKNSIEFAFLCRANSSTEIFPEAYELQTIPSHISFTDEPKWLQEHFPPEKHVLVLDGYNFDTLYQKKIKNSGYKVIYIDDLVEGHMYADIVLNHAPGIVKSDYSYEDYTIFGLGTKYSLLRSGFLKAAKEDRKVEKLESAFVCFGGADPLNLVYKTAISLLEIPSIKNINLVLGKSHSDQSFKKLLNSDGPGISIYRNLSEDKLIEVMKASDFAIVPSSTILYELCCVKMPIFCGYFVNNQKHIYQGFLESNAIWPLGDLQNFDTGAFTQKLKKFIQTGNYQSIMAAQKALFDGKIASRLSLLIKSLC